MSYSLNSYHVLNFFLDTHLHSWGGSGEAGLLSQGDNSVGLDGAQLESLAPGVRMF